MSRKSVVAVLVALAVLPACGGSSPAAPPPVTTPPTTLANFSGSYTGPMLYNVQGLAEVRVTGTTTVTHTGSTISFGNLTVVSSGTAVTFSLGNATQSGDQFLGTHTYQSTGCGTIGVRTTTRFGGRQMNLTADLTSSSCAASRVVGELSR